MGMGAGYGILAHTIFAQSYSHAPRGESGLMLLSFLIGIPLCIGSIAVYLLQRQKKAALGFSLLLSGASISIFVFIAGALLREGFICILMALPFLLFFAAIGTILSWIFSKAFKGIDKTLRSIIFLPFLFGAVEQQADPPALVQTIARSVQIRAAPATVWRNINFPTDIQASELKEGIAYQIGVPYPVEARTLEGRVGGKRHLIWQRGVSFEEEITAWEENRHIAWKYLFGPHSFPEGSLDDHIVIGGRYFNLEDTSYTLTPEAGGTRLDLAVTFRVSTNFNWYSGVWAKFLISDTAEAILNFYKNRAEAS